jgi:hypothetical protein
MHRASQVGHGPLVFGLVSDLWVSSGWELSGNMIQVEFDSGSTTSRRLQETEWRWLAEMRGNIGLFTVPDPDGQTAESPAHAAGWQG